MFRWIQKVLESGIRPNITLLEQNALIITNIGLSAAFVVNSILMFFSFALADDYDFVSLIAYALAAGSYLVSFQLLRSHQYIACRTLFSFTLVPIISFQTFLFGIHSGIQWYLFPIGIGSVLIWPLMRLPQLLVGIVSLIAFLSLFYFAPTGHIRDQFWTSAQLEYFAWFNYSVSFITTFIVVFSMMVVSERFQHHLEDMRLKASQKAKTLEEQMMASLNALALARDNETGNHIIRTQYYVKTIGDYLVHHGLFQSEINSRIASLLFKAAPLHDIGKIGIPDHILHKPGPLTDAEWEIMKSHTTIGESVLLSAEQQYAGEYGQEEDVVMLGVQIAGSHHEKWDGSGYPRGLAGMNIPLPSRIMALADMYDALVTERVYKNQWTHEQAINEIQSKSGTHFDPVIVDAFLEQQEKFKSISEKFKD